jgi:aspartate/methionine/tyrosine aminotransferase
MGNLALVRKVAEVYGHKMGRKIDPMTEVLITAGANSAINSIIFALIDPNKNEEVIVIEPCYPNY